MSFASEAFFSSTNDLHRITFDMQCVFGTIKGEHDARKLSQINDFFFESIIDIKSIRICINLGGHIRTDFIDFNS